MAEYIRREDALDCLKHYPTGKYAGENLYCAEIRAAADDINDLPAADVAPVVRCKDCKYFTKGPYVFDNSKCWCACWYDSVKDDDFCSYGAKKDLEESK